MHSRYTQHKGIVAIIMLSPTRPTQWCSSVHLLPVCIYMALTSQAGGLGFGLTPLFWPLSKHNIIGNNVGVTYMFLCTNILCVAFQNNVQWLYAMS